MKIVKLIWVSILIGNPPKEGDINRVALPNLPLHTYMDRYENFEEYRTRQTELKKVKQIRTYVSNFPALASASSRKIDFSVRLFQTKAGRGPKTADIVTILTNNTVTYLAKKPA